MTSDMLVNGCSCTWSREAESGAYEVRILADSPAAKLGVKVGDVVTLTYCATSFAATVGRLVITEGTT